MKYQRLFQIKRVGATLLPRIVVSSAYSNIWGGFLHNRSGGVLVAHVCWAPFRGFYRHWLI